MNLISLFIRKTNNKNFIPEIDGLRFFAIVTVVLFHLNTSFSRSLDIDLFHFFGTSEPILLGWWLVRLDLGVKVFFAISGFILSLPFIKKYYTNLTSIDFKDYFLRRLLRLEPPFVITLFLFAIGHVLFMGKEFNDISVSLLLSLFYLHGIVCGSVSQINPVTWSLETEAQFYLLIPFLFYFLFRIKKLTFILLILMLFFLFSIAAKNYILVNDINYLLYSICSYGSNFITGIFFAFLYFNLKNWINKKMIIFDFIGVFSIFLMFYFYKPQAAIYNNLIFNLSIFIFFISVFKGFILNSFFTNKFVYLIGGMCYSIYLIHYGFFYMICPFILDFFQNFSFNNMLFLSSIFSLIAMLIVTSIFYLIIEKPCMDKNWPYKLKNLLN